MQKILLASFAVLLFLPNLFNKDINPVLAYDKKEKFDSRLSYINSITKLEAHTDSIAVQKNITPGNYEYVELLENVLENRFYHGFSHFALSENWIAAIAGKFIKEDYACKVQPEEILQHCNAACSQQAIVMMAVLRNKKISYRSLGFPHHYAMGVLLKNDWYFFDANMEPEISRENRRLTNWKHHNDYLKKYYDTNRFNDLDYKFGNSLLAIVGVTNEVPARNARLFDAVTGLLSKICWIFPLFLMFYRPKPMRLPFSFRIPKKKPSFSLSV